MERQPNTLWVALKKLVFVFYKAGDHAVDHDGIEHAGYLAFLGLLALFPFLVVLLSIAGALGSGEQGREFVDVVFAQMPHNVVEALLPRIKEIADGPSEGLLTFAILGALWTSSSAVEGYRTILNRAYRVAAPPHFIWRRLLSIGQVLVLSFLIIMGMVTLVVLPILIGAVSDVLALPLTEVFDTLRADLVQFIILMLLMAVVMVLHKVLPNIKQPILWLMPGAFVTVLGWMFAARAFSYYLSGVNRINLVYGGLGGIIAVLVFFYVINVIFIYGAEFNYLLKAQLTKENDDD